MLDAGHIAFTPRAVLIEKEACGLCLPNRFKHLLERVGAVEEKHENGNVGHI